MMEEVQGQGPRGDHQIQQLAGLSRRQAMGNIHQGQRQGDVRSAGQAVG